MSDNHRSQSLFPTYIAEEEKYLINLGPVRFECTAKNSGRIVTFALGERNVLTSPSTNPFNFGTTFWTAPQSDWGWPPPSKLDSEAPYSASIEEENVVMQGDPCPELGVRITKRFSAAPSARSIRIIYEIENTSAMPVAYAPWEISRVHPGGLTFFPTGEGARPPTEQAPLKVEEHHGITWFNHSPATVTSQHKLFADGKEGWIAHIDRDRLFIKTFEDHPMTAAAPGEGEIEIYAVPEYVEVEQQGAYKEINPKDTYQWSVDWFLVQIPKSVTVTLGNNALIELVHQCIETRSGDR